MCRGNWRRRKGGPAKYTEVSRSISGSGGTNHVLPLKFHNVHGENISLHKNKTVARRSDSFCKGLTFTQRPVQIEEKVYVKLVEKSDNWSGVIRFGYTSHDPETLKDMLPKYACPDLTNQKGYWAKAVNEKYADEGATLYFYVTKSGYVHYGINGHSKEVFFSGVDTSRPLWVMIDVYGNSTAIELVNKQLNNITLDQEAGFNLNNSERHSNATLHYNGLGNDFNRMRLSEDVVDGGRQHVECARKRASIPVNDFARYTSFEPSSSKCATSVARLSNEYELRLSPLQFHEKHGRNIRLSNDRYIAARIDSYCLGYVFSSRPIRENEFLVVQVLKADKCNFAGSFTFGVIARDPSTINTNKLPEDADDLLARENYCVVYKDAGESPNEGDELIFSIAKDRDDRAVVQMKKNNEVQRILFYITDLNCDLWCFFDLYGSTTQIRAFTGRLPCDTYGSSSSRSSSSSSHHVVDRGTLPVMNENTHTSAAAVIEHQSLTNVPPVLVVKCCNSVASSCTVEPIKIIFHNQSAASATASTINVIPSDSFLPSSQLPNISSSRPSSGSEYRSGVPLPPRPILDHVDFSSSSSSSASLLDNSRNRDQQLQEWAKTKSRHNPMMSNGRPNECTVCYEQGVDAVLYTCGHMCMCFSCAVELWRGKGDGHCPICRAIIKDVIRTYKS